MAENQAAAPAVSDENGSGDTKQGQGADMNLITEKIKQLQKSKEAAAAEEKQMTKLAKRDLVEIKKKMPANAEEKVPYLMEKLNAALIKQHRTHSELGRSEQKVTALEKENEHVARQLKSTTSAKGTLEELCRRLQERYKTLEKASNEMQQEEEARRTKFNEQMEKTLGEVSEKMESDGEMRTQVMQENIELKGKLKKLIEFSDVQNAQQEKILEAAGLQAQLADAKFKEQQLIAESYAQKSGQLEQEVAAYKKLTEHLKSDMGTYSGKFEEIKEAFNQTNQRLTKTLELKERALKKLQNEHNTATANLTRTQNKLSGAMKLRDECMASLKAERQKVRQLQQKYDDLSKQTAATPSES